MAKRQIAVTGFGINSALGNGIDVNKRAIEAGISGIISTRPTWEQHKFKSLVAGNIELDSLKKIFDRKLSRFLGDPALLAAAAMKDAIAHSGLTDEEVQSPETGIIVGTGAGASITDVLFMCQRLGKKRGRKSRCLPCAVDYGIFTFSQPRQHFPNPRALIHHNFGVCDVGPRNHDWNGHDSFRPAKPRVRWRFGRR